MYGDTGTIRALAARLRERAGEIRTEAARLAAHADQVPWEDLRTAAERGAAVAVVLDRTPADSVQTVAAHLARMLASRGLKDSPLFVVHGANDPRVPIGESEQGDDRTGSASLLQTFRPSRLQDRDVPDRERRRVGAVMGVRER